MVSTHFTLSSSGPAPLRGARAAWFAGAALALAAPAALANETADPFVNPSFSVASDGFNELIAARIRVANLVAGIGGNVALPVTGGGGIFRRTSGTAYPASFGIYEWGGPRSTFEYAVADAADDLTAIVFQTFITVSISEGVDGLLEPANLPRLSYNGGTQFLDATTQVLQAVSGGFDMEGNPLPADPNNPNFATFTWDLSSLGAAVNSFRLTWATDAHSSTLAFQVDQIGAVPEPETLLMALMALGGIGLARRAARQDSADATAA